MIYRRHLKRLRRVLQLGVVALILNLILPNTNTVKAQTVATPDAGHSHAVILPLTESPENVALPSLPTVPDKPITVIKTVTVRASAYTSSRAETDNDPLTTASGSKVRDGIIAANGLPFGTKVRIPSHYGDKIFTVQDRMNAKWGNRKIDIWMTHRAEALQWGVRTVTIEIIS
jgi:3D (Asp-Asp-Asp) domain-containing protein